MSDYIKDLQKLLREQQNTVEPDATDISLIGEDLYQQSRELDRLEFDPSSSFDDSNENIYKGVFKPIEDAYQTIMKKPISLSSGEVYSKIWKKDDNLKIESELDRYSKAISQVANQDVGFATNVYGERKDAIVRDMAKNLYGLENYIREHPAMPPEGSAERKQLDSVIKETLKNSWSGISNMISAEAELEGIQNSQDLSFARERMLPSAQKVLGETIKSKAEPLGTLLNFLSTAYPLATGNSRLSGSEEWSEKLLEFGGEWAKKGSEKLEDPSIQPRGKYAMAMKDLGLLEGALNPKYAIATASESAITNVMITGVGLIASALSPGKKLKIAAGAIGSALPGYALESSSAETETIEELKNIRRQARVDKKNLDKDEFASLYTYYLGKNYSITADELTDENIASIAKRVGGVYGILSAGVEGFSTGLEVAAATKFFKDATSIGLFAQSAAKGKLAKTIMTGKDITQWGIKGFGVEAIEEATQETLNQYLVRRNVPFYDWDPSRVWKAAYAGGVFGTGMSTAMTGMGYVKGRRAQTKRDQSGRKDIEDARKNREEGTDLIPEDKLIKAGLHLALSPADFVDKIAASDPETFDERQPVIQIRTGELAATINEWKNPEDLVKIFKDEKIKELFNITEEKLMTRVGFFTDEQVADILGVKVDELQYEHSQIKRGKPASKKKSKYQPKNKKNYSDKRKRGKQSLEDIERSESFETYEYEQLLNDKYEIENDRRDLQEAMEGQILSAEDVMPRIKKLDKALAEVNKKIKGLASQAPRKKTKDPLATEKQKLITRANKIGDESFTTEDWKKLDEIKTTKKKEDLKQYDDIIAAAENKREKEDSEPKKVDIRGLMDSEISVAGINIVRDDLVEIENKVENFDGDKRTKEYKGLVKQQKDLEAKLSEIESNLYEPLGSETLDNVAENIHDTIKAGNSGLPFGKVLYNRSQLEQMSDSKLQAIAQDEKIDSTDRNEIIANYLDNMGDPGINDIEMLNMGIPLKMPKILINRKNKSQFNAEMNEAWRQMKDRHGLDEYAFEAWATEVAKRLPGNTRDAFLQWAESANTLGPVSSVVDKAITGLFGRSDIFTPQEQNVFSDDIDFVSEQIKETAPAKNDEDSDLSADSENVINTRVFNAFQSNVNTEIFEYVVSSVNNNEYDSFDAFLNEISDPAYGMLNSKGETPVEAANKSETTRLELKQFYISKLPENFVETNRGNKEGVRKNIQLVYIPRTDKFSSKGVSYKDTKSGFIKTGWGRAIIAENLIEGINDDIVWLDKADIKVPIGESKFATRGGLSAVELAGLTKKEFREAGLIPLMMRNDSGRMVLAIVKDEHNSQALQYKEYWDKEIADGFVTQELADIYSGKNIKEADMKRIRNSAHEYRAGQIARHETLKKIYGTTYSELSQQDLMLRNSVIFSTALSNVNGDPSSIYVFDYKKDNMGDVKFVTEFNDGKKESINAIQMIDGEPQYIADGQTFTSERVFNTKYYNEMGALPTAKRAKTVKFGYDETGVLLEKHQEMTFSLPEGSDKAQLIDNGLVVAEFRREDDGVNIYVREEGSQNFKYVDHLGSRDEVKVMTGKWNQMNKIMSLPSGSTGHINLTSRDKNKANFPFQVLNYIQDERLLDAVSDMYSKRTGDAISPEQILFNMVEALSDGDKMNAFIKRARASYPGTIPRMIENFAEVGSGIHPSTLDLAMAMLKNKMLAKSQDFLQRGGVLDFRASVTENLASDEMIMSSDHAMRRHISYQLAQKLNKTFKEINSLNTRELNNLLKNNPVEVMMVRFPVPSQSGFRVMKITKLEKGLGDSFKVSPKVVKEVFEGDHDHDTGHITILESEITELLKENQVPSTGINMVKFQKNDDTGTIADINGSFQTMSALTQGKRAIGEVASLQRNYGVIQHYMNDITIDDSKIILNNLDSPVTDPDMILADTGKPEEQSLGMLLRTYAQAAFDNPKLRFLDKWKYSSKKLIGLMFQRVDGKPLTDAQINTLDLFMKEHNKAAHIRNGKLGSTSLKLEEILGLSLDYENIVENRKNQIVYNVGDAIEQSKDGEEYAVFNSISVNRKVHPMEVRAMAPYKKIKDKGLIIGNLTDSGNVTSTIAHTWATARILDNNYRVQMTAKSIGMTLEQFQDLSREEFAIVQDDVSSGVDWGRAAHSKLLDLYAKTYSNLVDDGQAQSIDPNSWDHNVDFNTFYHNLHNDGIGGLSAYKDLSRTQQVAATFAFLDRFITSDGISADYVGKLLPVSKEGITLLDPEVMGEYFNFYNKAAKRHILGSELPGIENIRATKVSQTYVEELRRFYGCE